MPEWRSELRVKSRKWLILLALRDGLLGAARLAPSGPPFGRSTWPSGQVVEPGLFYVGGSNCGRKTGLAKNRFSGRKPMAPRDGLFGASRLTPRLTLGVALKGDQLGLRPSCRTGLFSVGGSNLCRSVGERGRPRLEFFRKLAPRDGFEIT